MRFGIPDKLQAAINAPTQAVGIALLALGVAVIALFAALVNHGS